MTAPPAVSSLAAAAAAAASASSNAAAAAAATASTSSTSAPPPTAAPTRLASSGARVNRHGSPLRGASQKTTPVDVAAYRSSSSTSGHKDADGKTNNENSSNVRRAPLIERQHVHAVYDTIADHWSHTRYRAWPRVAEFLAQLPENSCVADLGMGNGKNVIAGLRDCQRNIGYFLGTDISAPLVYGAAEKIWTTSHSCKSKSSSSTSDFSVADCVSLPIRTGLFDASICIAVLHHLSTVERRVAVLRESLRVVRPGGRFLVYAWAQEQEATGCSRHIFDAQDVLVKWHHKIPGLKKSEESRERLEGLQRKAAGAIGTEGPPGGGADEATTINGEGRDQEKAAGESSGRCTDEVELSQSNAPAGVLDLEKGAIVYQRYCHVYREGELEGLFRDHVADLCEIEEVYLDTGNWCVRARRI